MQTRPNRFSGLIWIIASAALSHASALAPPRIPPLDGVSFAGNHVSLPAAFADKTGILVLGFTRASQTSARAWGELIANHYLADSSVAFYELPVLEDVPSLLRKWVAGRIRHDVALPARAHFLPVLSGEAEWKQVAGESAAQDDATVLVVDGSGTVLWRNRSPASAAAFAELQRQVASRQHH